ncbi:MAG: nicotinamide mononucleotide transporter [Bacilli bacterium]|nr:nicotinamide mononucleotide transporter [Bacilli bacterium]
MKKKYIIITIICLVISVVSGIISKDLVVGGSMLFSGLLCAYLASEGKKINYIFGFISYILMGYVAFKNNLFGIFFFYIFIFAPLQIKGFATWGKNLNRKNDVKVREFTLSNSIIITLSCIAGSLLLGYILTLIPTQRLAFMDATSNCINLCGIILMILRFKEAWWLWLINNIIDLVIWIITVVHGGDGSTMVLLVSIGYLLINIYGIIKWSIAAKKTKKKYKIA